MQIKAVIIRALAEREDFMLVAEVRNDSRFFKAFGDVSGWLVAFKFVGQAHAYQITDAYLYREGATTGGAIAAQAIAIFDPGVDPVDIDGGNQDFFHQWP